MNKQNLYIGLISLGLVAIVGFAVYFGPFQSHQQGQVLGTIIYDNDYGYQMLNDDGSMSPIATPTQQYAAPASSSGNAPASVSASTTGQTAMPVASATTSTVTSATGTAKTAPAAVEPKSISIVASSLQVAKGKTITLTATVTGTNGKKLTTLRPYWTAPTGSFINSKLDTTGKHLVITYKAPNKAGAVTIQTTLKTSTGVAVVGTKKITVK